MVWKESSMAREDIKDKANLRENIIKMKLHSPSCSIIKQKKSKLQEKTTDKEKKVNIFDKMHEENNKQHDLKEPDCSYTGEIKIIKVECPNCEHKFYIGNEILKNKVSLSASEELRPPCGTPIKCTFV